MNNKISRYSYLFMALALLLSLVAGCSDKDRDINTTTAAKTFTLCYNVGDKEVVPASAQDVFVQAFDKDGYPVTLAKLNDYSVKDQYNNEKVQYEAVTTVSENADIVLYCFTHPDGEDSVADCTFALQLDDIEDGEEHIATIADKVELYSKFYRDGDDVTTVNVGDTFTMRVFLGNADLGSLELSDYIEEVYYDKAYISEALGTSMTYKAEQESTGVNFDAMFNGVVFLNIGSIAIGEIESIALICPADWIVDAHQQLRDEQGNEIALEDIFHEIDCGTVQAGDSRTFKAVIVYSNGTFEDVTDLSSANIGYSTSEALAPYVYSSGRELYVDAYTPDEVGKTITVDMKDIEGYGKSSNCIKLEKPTSM